MKQFLRELDLRVEVGILLELVDVSGLDDLFELLDSRFILLGVVSVIASLDI